MKELGEILSQSEIDALLKSYAETGSTGTSTETVKSGSEPKLYDFKIPAKFNKDHLRTLEIIFDNFGRIATSFLTAYLRTSVSIEVANAQQIPYKEFSNSIINPAILAIINLHPLKGSILMDMSSAIGYSIIDRILGGPGLTLKKIRDFSEIEKVLLQRIVSQILGYLVEPFENVVEINPQLQEIETNPQFAQVIAPTEIIALITLSIKVGTTEGFLNFCIPHIVIEPIIERLNTRLWFDMPAEDTRENYEENIELQLEKANIGISAVVGKTYITVRDFVQLQVGDTITLDSYINSDLHVMVGNLLKFQAKPGISRGHNAIQITSLVEKEDDI